MYSGGLWRKVFIIVSDICRPPMTYRLKIILAAELGIAGILRNARDMTHTERVCGDTWLIDFNPAFPPLVSTLLF